MLIINMIATIIEIKIDARRNVTRITHILVSALEPWPGADLRHKMHSGTLTIILKEIHILIFMKSRIQTQILIY